MSETTPLTGGEIVPPDPEKAEQPPTVKPPDFIRRVKDARDKSEGPLDFLKAFFLLLLDTSKFLSLFLL